MDLSTTPSSKRPEKEKGKKPSAMLRDSTTKADKTANSYDSINGDDVYMNETFSNGIPLEKLDSIVAEQGTKEYGDFKKEYAVSLIFLTSQIINNSICSCYLHKKKTVKRGMCTLIIIIYSNNDYGLVKVYFRYRRCHQVKYTVAMSERGLKTFQKTDSRQRSLVSNLHFDCWYTIAKDFAENNSDLIEIMRAILKKIIYS